MATMPTSPDAGATRISVMPSAIARNPLMPIMPSTCRLMGWWGMASPHPQHPQGAVGQQGAAHTRMPEALTASIGATHHHRFGDDGTEAPDTGRR